MTAADQAAALREPAWMEAANSYTALMNDPAAKEFTPDQCRNMLAATIRVACHKFAAEALDGCVPLADVEAMVRVFDELVKDCACADFPPIHTMLAQRALAQWHRQHPEGSTSACSGVTPSP